METTVIHVRDMKPGDVYVGRKMPRQHLAGSPFGNPFKEGMNAMDACRIIHDLGGHGSHCIQLDAPTLTREKAIEFYRVWLTSQPHLVKLAVAILKGQRLACWCHPKPCHADVLVELLDGKKGAAACAD